MYTVSTCIISIHAGASYKYTVCRNAVPLYIDMQKNDKMLSTSHDFS